MKKSRSALVVIAIAASLLITGCFGSFALSKKVYDWNKGVSGDAVVQSVVMWALLIVPVYSTGFVADLLILNTLEAATGSNPISRADGSVEVGHAGHHYEVLPAGEGVAEVRRDGVTVGFARRDAGDRVIAFDAHGDELPLAF